MPYVLRAGLGDDSATCTCVNYKCVENANDCFGGSTSPQIPYPVGTPASVFPAMSFTDWLNQNTGVAVGIAAAGVLVLFMAKR